MKFLQWLWISAARISGCQIYHRVSCGPAACVGTGCKMNFPGFAQGLSAGQSVSGSHVPEKRNKEAPKGTQTRCNCDES